MSGALANLATQPVIYIIFITYIIIFHRFLEFIYENKQKYISVAMGKPKIKKTKQKINKIINNKFKNTYKQRE